jgi:hypothetical protein
MAHPRLWAHGCLDTKPGVKPFIEIDLQRLYALFRKNGGSPVHGGNRRTCLQTPLDALKRPDRRRMP